jgi:hypothetical protein
MPKVFGLQKSNTFESATFRRTTSSGVSSRSVLWRIPAQMLRPKGCRERLTGPGGRELGQRAESVEIFIQSEFVVS